MAILTLDIDTVFQGKSSNQKMTIGSNTWVVPASEHYFCPFLSIKIKDDCPPELILHSVFETHVMPETQITYSIYLNSQGQITLPRRGTTMRILSENNTFSIIMFKDSKIHARIFAKVLHIDHCY